MNRPHLVFLAALVIAPIVAIAGVAGGDPWRWPAVAAASGVIGWAAARSFLALRREQPPRPRILRMRMMALTATVAACMAALCAIAIVAAAAG